MSSETSNEQFKTNMLAEIKNILTDLSQIKEMASGTKRKPARRASKTKRTTRRR